MGELEDVLRRAAEKLDEKDYGLIKAVIESYAYLTESVGDKDTTIRRLRQMFFGAKTEKTSAVVGGLKGTERGSAVPETTAMPGSSASTDAEAQPPRCSPDNLAELVVGHGPAGFAGTLRYPE
jgi:hypothetical protein